jgi:hypothetical protein
MFKLFGENEQLTLISKDINLIMATIDQIASDFSAFQTTFTKFSTDFATFVTETQATLAQLAAAGGITSAQQAELNTVDTGLTQASTSVANMDSQIQAITFPGTAPTIPTTPATPSSVAASKVASKPIVAASGSAPKVG